MFDEWASIEWAHEEGLKFKLSEELRYRPKAGGLYVVPQGFPTDLASIPVLLWFFLPPFGNYLSAAVLHDWFCKQEWISRLDGDKLFLEAMLASNVKLWKAYVMYYGVRAYAVMGRVK